ncbi:MAG: hypothetical protein KJ737_24870 [Proteobacteria bacterium]|nr:hypothetical protein [Pseudomonadota bacterium]
MYLLFTVLNNEDLLDTILTGWIDMGITDSTVIETTDALQLISHHIPIFAGFRILTSGGVRHNKTLMTVIDDEFLVDGAIDYLKKVCQETGKTNQGKYFVVPLSKSGLLGRL